MLSIEQAQAHAELLRTVQEIQKAYGKLAGSGGHDLVQADRAHLENFAMSCNDYAVAFGEYLVSERDPSAGSAADVEEAPRARAMLMSLWRHLDLWKHAERSDERRRYLAHASEHVRQAAMAMHCFLNPSERLG